MRNLMVISFLLWIVCYLFQEILSSDTRSRPRIPPVQENFTREFTKFFPFYDQEKGKPGRILAKPEEYRECLWYAGVYTAPITLFISCPTLFYEDGADFCAYRFNDTPIGYSKNSRCFLKRAQMFCQVFVWSPFQEEINDRTTWLNIRSYRDEDNNLKNIKNSTFSTSYSHFLLLNLGQNGIGRLEPFAFTYLPNLQYLTLEKNRIKELQDNTFHGLAQLRGLVLTQNKITDLRKYSFTPLQNLTLLYLNYNEISTIENSTFNLKTLEILALTHNNITELYPNGTFYGLENLIMLHLADNEIETLQENTFTGLGKLKSLILNNNKINNIEKGSLNGLTSLIELELENNEIKEIKDGSFKNLGKLSYLNLRFNFLKTIKPNVVNNFFNLTLVTDDLQVCCSVKKYKEINECITDIDYFSSCNNLITDKLLEYLIWILGAISIVANGAVVVLRILNMTTNKKHSYLIINLAISDSLMGIYLLIIAFKNWEYRDRYSYESQAWRASDLCQFAGFLCTLSCETTVFLLTIITIDRLLVIKNPLGNRQINISKIVALIALCWISAAVIATLPLSFVGIKYFKDVTLTYYGRSGVCLPLHLSSNKPNGWQYSIFVYIVLNAISFITIAISYTNMYWEVKKTHSAVRRHSESALEKSMAFRMTLLVLTDAACWTPVIIIGILTMYNFDPPSEIYPWMAVIVLPTNAALNPILYTLSSIPTIRNITSRMRIGIGNFIRFVSSTSGRRRTVSSDVN